MRGTLFLFLICGGCVSESFTVTQAGTTPAPRPMLYDGQPLDRGARFEMRSTSVVTPVGDGDKPSGNFVSRQHTDLSVRGSRGNTDVGFQLGVGWTKGASEASPALGPKPDSMGAITGEALVRHSFPINEDFRLGTGIGMGIISVPITYGDTTQTENDEALAFELSVVPSWRKGPLALFGGINFTTEAYVPRQIIAEDGFDYPEATTDGAIVFSAGASYTLASGLHLQGALAKPVSDLAQHGLQIDVSIGFDFGSKPQPRPAGPPPPPPGYYYPPPPPPTTTAPPPTPAGPGGT